MWFRTLIVILFMFSVPLQADEQAPPPQTAPETSGSADETSAEQTDKQQPTTDEAEEAEPDCE